MIGPRTGLEPHLEDVVEVASCVTAAGVVARVNVTAASPYDAAGDPQEWWCQQGRQCLDWTVQVTPARAVHPDLPRTSFGKIMGRLVRGLTEGRQRGDVSTPGDRSS
jgi:acyl-coenzyme A synthetase/AMP-(fatty) acid ligase